MATSTLGVMTQYLLQQCKNLFPIYCQKMQKRSDIKPLLEAPYKMPDHQPKKASVMVVARSRKVPHQSPFMKEAVATVNKILASENNKLEEMYRAGASMLLAKDKQIEKLKRHLREVTHNMRRKIKRKNSKINEYTTTMKHLKSDNKSSKQDITSRPSEILQS